MALSFWKYGFQLTCVLSIFCRAGFSANCAKCQEYTREISASVALEANTSSLLQKNRAYLEKYGKIDVSKDIKLRSNILILSLRLETVRNNLEATRTESAQKGCAACLPNKK